MFIPSSILIGRSTAQTCSFEAPFRPTEVLYLCALVKLLQTSISTFRVFALLVDGRWSDWRPWGACSRSCGSGEQIRLRTCTKPRPAHGGKQCPGSNRESRPCNTNDCPGNNSMGKSYVLVGKFAKTRNSNEAEHYKGTKTAGSNHFSIISMRSENAIRTSDLILSCKSSVNIFLFPFDGTATKNQDNVIYKQT